MLCSQEVGFSLRQLLELSLFCFPVKGLSRTQRLPSDLLRATCPEEFHFSFWFLFCHAEFLAAATNLCSSSANGPSKIAYPTLKRLPRSELDFFLHLFNLAQSLHAFPFIWNTSSAIPIYRTLKPLDSPASFRSVSYPASQCFLNASFYRVYSFFGV